MAKGLNIFKVTCRKFQVFHLTALFVFSIYSIDGHAASQRVISTSPAITEILFALGAGDRVVGVTDYCSFPKKACLLPSICGPLKPSTETMISLKTDLIIIK